MLSSSDPFTSVFGNSRGKPLVRPYLRGGPLLEPFIEQVEDIVRPLIWLHGGEGVCSNELAMALACDNQAHGKKAAYISLCSNEQWIRDRFQKQMKAFGYRGDIWPSLAFGVTYAGEINWESMAKQCAWKADIVFVEGVTAPLTDMLGDKEITQEKMIANLREYAALEDAAYVICSEPMKDTVSLLPHTSYESKLVVGADGSQLLCQNLASGHEVLRLDYTSGEGVTHG